MPTRVPRSSVRSRAGPEPPSRGIWQESRKAATAWGSGSRAVRRSRRRSSKTPSTRDHPNDVDHAAQRPRGSDGRSLIWTCFASATLEGQSYTVRDADLPPGRSRRSEAAGFDALIGGFQRTTPTTTSIFNPRRRRMRRCTPSARRKGKTLGVLRPTGFIWFGSQTMIQASNLPVPSRAGRGPSPTAIARVDDALFIPWNAQFNDQRLTPGQESG